MKNNLLSPTQTIAKLAFLATILGVTNQSIAQAMASNEKNKTQSSINTASSMSATDFAVANVGKYYPDMVDYTKNLMNSFISKDQKDFVNKTLTELIKKYPNDKEKISFIISTLEGRVLMTKPIFTDTYCLEPTDLDFDLDDAFNNVYRARFNANLTNLQQRIKEIEENIKNKEENIKNKEENIKNNIQEINKSLSIFSIEDIQKDKNAYETVKKIKIIFRETGQKGSSHTEELFSIIK